MPGHELALEMIAAAKSDLKALKHMLDPDAFDDRVFGFHAQQAIEKALKAWLCCLGVEYPLTHDLASLLALLQSKAQDVNEFWSLIEYGPFAVEFRYDEVSSEEEPLDRGLAAQRIDALLGQVAKLLDSRAQS